MQVALSRRSRRLKNSPAVLVLGESPTIWRKPVKRATEIFFGRLTQSSVVRLADSRNYAALFPAMNRWAIVSRPLRGRNRKTRKACVAGAKINNEIDISLRRRPVAARRSGCRQTCCCCRAGNDDLRRSPIELLPANPRRRSYRKIDQKACGQVDG